MLPFSLKESRQANPLQVPQWGPCGEKYPLTGHISFYLSLRVPGKGAPSMFPDRVPMGSDTPSPEPLVYFSFIHACMSARVPKKEPSYIHVGKNIMLPSMKPHADRRPMYNGVRPSSPRGSLRRCYLYPSTMQPSAQYLPPWLG